MITMSTDEQNALLNRLREMLQSIAILAVKAQSELGNPDAVSDCLVDIAADLEKADKINAKLGGY